MLPLHQSPEGADGSDEVPLAVRPTTADDRPALAAIRRHPEVMRWWGPVDGDEFAGDADTHLLTIDLGGPIGTIELYEEPEPRYRHAAIDVLIDPALRGRGIGAEAVRLLVCHLFDGRGHHRATIDPAAHNAAAIRAYTKVGFRPVGLLRAYERGLDGSWHDGLLMDILAGEERRQPIRPPGGTVTLGVGRQRQ